MSIEELKRLAEAATPGPWAHGVTWIEHLGGIVALGNTARSKQDVAYVAAANHAAILELIRQRDELLAALKALDRGCRDPHCIGVLHGLDLARTAIAKAEG